MDGLRHIDLADWIEADSDEEAMHRAREIRGDAHECEVWLKDRLVARLGADGRMQRVPT